MSTKTEDEPRRCSLCRCAAVTTAFGFPVCNYHRMRGENDPPCPSCLTGRPLLAAAASRILDIAASDQPGADETALRWQAAQVLGQALDLGGSWSRDLCALMVDQLRVVLMDHEVEEALARWIDARRLPPPADASSLSRPPRQATKAAAGQDLAGEAVVDCPACEGRGKVPAEVH